MSLRDHIDPLITVVLPVFNAMPYLPAALQSLFRQSEGRFAILAIDDGSSDEGLAYLLEIRDPRFRVTTQPHAGLVSALNRGLESVRTPFIARMDADDICHPERLGLQMRYLEHHPESVLVGCSAEHIGTDGTGAGWQVHMPLRHEEIIAAMLARKSAIIHPTILCRTSALRECGGYAEGVWPAEDYDLFLRLGLRGRLANLPECLYSIRLHGSSITARSILSSQKRFDEVRRKYLPAYQQVMPKIVSRELRTGLVRDLGLEVDARAVYLYRRGITRWVNKSRLLGGCFVIASAMLSPWRTKEYLKRLLRWGKEGG